VIILHDNIDTVISSRRTTWQPTPPRVQDFLWDLELLPRRAAFPRGVIRRGRWARYNGTSISGSGRFSCALGCPWKVWAPDGTISYHYPTEPYHRWGRGKYTPRTWLYVAWRLDTEAAP